MAIKQGHWQYNNVYRDCLIAKEWGKTPSEFWALSKEDQLLMIATVEASGEMQSWDDQVSNKSATTRSLLLDKNEGIE